MNSLHSPRVRASRLSRSAAVNPAVSPDLHWIHDGVRYRATVWPDVRFEHETAYDRANVFLGRVVATYDNLERTNFATLYAVTSPGDDFAESFASYVHTVLMKKPFAIRIYQHGKLVKVYRSCWDEARCAEKRKLIERFLNIAG